MQPTLLAVCGGNVCRSPAVERLLALRLDDSIAIGSAGVHALVGDPIARPMAALLSAQGATTSNFAARQLTAELVEQATVIITMTLEQRAEVVSLVPGAVRRTFTLLELARLVANSSGIKGTYPDDATRWAALPPLANAHRHELLGAKTSLDLADPYGKTARHYRVAMARIVSALDTIDQAVRPRSSLGLAWRPEAVGTTGAPSPAPIPIPIPVATTRQARRTAPRHARPRSRGRSL